MTSITWYPLLSPIQQFIQERADALAELSLAFTIIIGWLGAFSLIGLGRLMHNQRFVAVGAVGLGIMTIATPLGTYISETSRRGGLFEATMSDFALLAVFGFLGGIIAAVSFARLWTRPTLEETPGIVTINEAPTLLPQANQSPHRADDEQSYPAVSLHSERKTPT